MENSQSHSCLENIANLIVKSDEIKIIFTLSQKIFDDLTNVSPESKDYYKNVLRGIQTDIDKLVGSDDVKFIEKLNKDINSITLPSMKIGNIQKVINILFFNPC